VVPDSLSRKDTRKHELEPIMASITNTFIALPNQILNYLSNLFTQILETLNLTNKTGTLLLLGLDNAGKTTLLHRLRTNTITSFPPTERPNTESFTMGGISFLGMDLGGHEAVRHLWEDYCVSKDEDGVGALVFLLDVVDYQRLEEVRDELDNLISILLESRQLDALEYDEDHIDPEEGNSVSKKGDVIPLAILLNKCDMNNALESREIARVIEYEEITRRYGSDNVGMFRISVWRGEGYQEAFRWISEFL